MLQRGGLGELHALLSGVSCDKALTLWQWGENYAYSARSVV